VDLPPETLSITFVGTPEEWATLKRRHGAALRRRLRDFFQVRPNVVFEWLSFLKAVHPAYADVVIRDGAEVRAALDALEDTTLSQVYIVAEPSAIEVQAGLGGDVAHARDTGMMDPAQWAAARRGVVHPDSMEDEGASRGGSPGAGAEAHGGNPDSMEDATETAGAGGAGAGAGVDDLTITWDTSLVCEDPAAVADDADARLISALQGLLCPRGADDDASAPPIVGVSLSQGHSPGSFR
jgi:hypothetical protein